MWSERIGATLVSMISTAVGSLCLLLAVFVLRAPLFDNFTTTYMALAMFLIAIANFLGIAATWAMCFTKKDRELRYKLNELGRAAIFRFKRKVANRIRCRAFLVTWKKDCAASGIMIAAFVFLVCGLFYLAIALVF